MFLGLLFKMLFELLFELLFKYVPYALLKILFKYAF